MFLRYLRMLRIDVQRILTGYLSFECGGISIETKGSATEMWQKYLSWVPVY